MNLAEASNALPVANTASSATGFEPSHPLLEQRAARRAGNPCPVCPAFVQSSRLSVVDGDNARLDLAVYGPPPEPPGDRLCCDVGCSAEP
jgi:hypothetical protein